MKTPIFVLLLLYFGFAVGAAERNPPSAQEVIIDLDPSKSTVQFALSAVLHTVQVRSKSNAARFAGRSQLVRPAVRSWSM